jgi:acetylornithine/succinyldiaminopimelate/putrescine aminotransferase
MRAAKRTGALVIADEVQSGSGRTGTFLGGPSIGLSADLVSLAKALGGGVPIGAVVMSQAVADAVVPGDHGTTYGGNLLSCRAALTVLDALDGGLQQAIARVSTHLFAGLRALAARHAVITDVRGAGLIAGIELETDALAVVNAALGRGLIINRTSGTTLRLLPPYIASEQDVDEALAILSEALTAAR